MADSLQIGTSALLAYSRSLATVGHNIANANVDGYSRQRVDLGTQSAQFTGVGYFGSGVQINDVRRIVDNFTIGELRTSSTSYNQFEAFYGLTSQVDNLLADPQAGLAPKLQDFFNAVQELADDPASNTARQVLLSEAGSLAQRFESIDSRLETLQQNSNILVRDSINEINSIATAIGDINQDIALRTRSNGTQLPNDLLDQRDRLVLRLSELVSVKTVTQQDGALNVFIGNGQGLVVGNTVNTLKAVNNSFDPSQTDVAIAFGSLNVNITSQLTGGQLGGTIDFREQVITPARNALGRVAVGISSVVNTQHRLGQDLNGQLGGDFFSAPAVGIQQNAQNTGAASVTASFVDVGQVTTSDYVLSFDGSNYTIVRSADNQLLYNSAAAAPFSTTIDGVQFNVSAGALTDDSWLIRPTFSGASNIDVNIKNTDLIAAAAPLRGQSSIGNLGEVSLALGATTNVTSLPLSANGGDITLTFDPDALGAGVPGFTVTGGPGGTLAYDPATEFAGKQFTLGAPFDGISFSVSGTPVANDTLLITDNTNGVSDNRNALLLAGLQGKVTLQGNNSLQSAYGQLVADVGVRTRQAEVSRDAQQVLLRQSEAARESVSGVNLDEEAADLVRLQQAYQAAAQVISTTDSLFQELMGVLRG